MNQFVNCPCEHPNGTCVADAGQEALQCGGSVVAENLMVEDGLAQDAVRLDVCSGVSGVDGVSSDPEHGLHAHSRRFAARDSGSGTVMGATLIVVAAMLLIVIAAGANVLLSVSRAHTAADQGALAAASALRDGKSNVCVRSALQVKANNAAQESCSVVQEDVTVKVSVSTAVPFVPKVRAESRAGPVDCK